MNYAIVGAFVLGLGAALIAVALWLAAGGATRKAYDPYLALLDESVAGLNLNAPVKYNGVDVGKVRSIQLDPVKPDRVRLIFAIERSTPIRQDTVAVLKTQGLTGIAYVELDGGAGDSPPLLATPPEPYPVIRTKASLSARLENVLTRVLAKLDSTSSNIDAMLSNENRLAVTSALADIAVLSRTLAARKDTLDAALVNASRTFDNGARVTAQLGPVLERIGRSADAVGKLGDEGALASVSASKTVAAMGAEVQRSSTETLPQLQQLMGEMGVLSGALRRWVQETERNPSPLLFGRTPVPPGPGESTAGASPP